MLPDQRLSELYTVFASFKFVKVLKTALCSFSFFFVFYFLCCSAVDSSKVSNIKKRKKLWYQAIS